jgi:hypothetical protein
MRLAHSLVTGELVVLALADPTGAGPSEDELRQEGSIFGEIVSPYVHAIVDWNPELPFVAWEYTTAWPLSTAIRTAPLPDVSTVLDAMQELALGLGAVHARGAVYRGLHPGRIMIMRDGSARLATTADAVLDSLDKAHVRPPRSVPVPYIAPEQLEGVTSFQSDLYSLGAVGYELLTGQRLVADVDAVTQAVIIKKGEPTPPSALRRGVPEEVDELFARLLARDPAARLDSALGLADALARLAETTSAPDADPLAAFLAIQPVVAPLLAEDVAESEIYAALHTQPDVEPAGTPPRRAESSRRERSGTASSNESIGDGRVAKLVGPGGETFVLDGARVVIGRRGQGEPPAVDLSELDPGKVVSREHAVLDLGEGRWYISELSARNGTWLNGERVRKGSFLRLRVGDQIRIANVHLSYALMDWPQDAADGFDDSGAWLPIAAGAHDDARVPDVGGSL